LQSIRGYSARLIIEYYKSLGSWEQLLPATRVSADKLHRRNLQYKIWQEDYYDFNIFTLQKYQEKLNYIHNNPVKAGLVEKPQNYKWSSYRSLYLGDDEVLKVDQFRALKNN
jgi:hypothetical protein